MKGHNYGICRRCGRLHEPIRANLGKNLSQEARQKLSAAQMCAAQKRREKDRRIISGEIKYGREIGKSKTSGHTRFLWHTCVDCDKERWVRLKKDIPVSQRCFPCYVKRRRYLRGNSSPSWKGGRYNNGEGYILVLLQPDNFFYPMAQKDGHVLEHRLIMARNLNRCLLPWEVVHHRNGIRNDNRLENLELIGCGGRHNSLAQTTLKRQVKQIKELQARTILLETELQISRAKNK